MDNGIAAIITSGIASLVSFIIFIGSNIFTRMNADKPYKIKIYERQLFEVFMPLMILIEKSGPEVTPELLKEIGKIIYSNFTLIPDTLLCEYEKLVKPSSDNKLHTTFVLRDIIATYYNSRRKDLGYPFKREAINIRCLDGDESWIVFVKSLKNTAFITLVLFLAVAALSVFLAFVDKEWMSVIKQLLLIYITLTFGLWLNNSTYIRRKGSQYKKAYKKSAQKADSNQKLNKPHRLIVKVKPTTKQNYKKKNK